MKQTWQADYMDRLGVANLDTGDVALCGAFDDRASILADLDERRIAFIAPLASRAELEWLVRGLHLHPGIGHLVVFGDDVRVQGDALLALWREGLDEHGRISGSRGRLGAPLDAAVVDPLRADVTILDMRGRPAAEVAAAIADLPALAPEREALSLADPAIPERKVFLSRKTSFPVFSSDTGDAWLQLLNLALRIGAEKRSSDGTCMAEALNVVVTIGLPVIAEDLEVEGFEEPGEFPSFIDFGADDFERYYRRRTDLDRPLHGDGRLDRFDALCDRLKSATDAQSGTLVFAQADDARCAQSTPNLISATFNVVDGAVYGSFVFRSLDVYSDWPLEAMALIRVHREVAARVGLEVGAATFVVHCARLLACDWERAGRLLDESFKRPLPLQVDHSGIFLFGNDGGQARAMLLDHDAGTIFWEDAFDTPEQLSWYIVDSMPWLLPQHIRYVGQECSSLRRAMQESECYLQG